MEHGKFVPVHKGTKEEVASRIPLNMDVLDFGARNGEFRTYLNQHEYTGIDINPQTPDIIKMDGLKLKFDKQFDYVVSLSCLEHMDIICGLKNIYKVLKPGGKTIVTLPNAYSYRNLLQRLLKSKGGSLRTGHFYTFNNPDVINLFEHAGFINIKVQIFGILIPKTNIYIKRYSPRGEHIIIEAQKGYLD